MSADDAGHDQVGDAGVEPDRRRFMSRAVAAAAGLLAATFGGISAAYVSGGGSRSRADRWVPVTRVSRLQPGQPVLVEFLEVVPDAWATIRRRRSLWLVRAADGGVTALDPRCTHLGCPVDWSPADRNFRCPCHRGVFDAEGKVLSGPPPRSLDRVEGRVDGDRLFVPSSASA